MAQADQMNTQFACLRPPGRPGRDLKKTEVFTENLAMSCSAEERIPRTAMLRVLAQRGLGKTAKAKVDDVIRRSDRRSRSPKNG